jgi:putative tricarboxylic transport membrane protein
MGLLGGIVPLVIGLVAGIGAYALELGQLSKPGPGLWPFILAVMLVACSLILFVKDVRKDNYEKFTGKTKLVIYSIAATAVFIVIFKTLGMVPAVVGLLIFQLRVVGAETWKMSALVTAGMTVAVYLLFSLWLKIPFPGLLSLLERGCFHV